MRRRPKLGSTIAATMVTLLLLGALAYAAPEPQQRAGDGAADISLAAASAARSPSRLTASPTKPVAPIAIEYAFSSHPALGVPFEVQITANGREGTGELVLTVHADDGLVAGAPQLTTSASEGAQCNWIVAATAFKEGTLYLDVLVQGTAGDQHPSRNLVIPIRIDTTAPPPMAATQSAARAPSGRVIVLPSANAR